jgi:mono/diheme cytochrome c family protein
MTIFFIKSILAVVLLLAACYTMYTMFMVFGRTPDAERVVLLKVRHRTAGYLYVVLLLAITYLCVDFVIAARTDPSPRAALHILLALSIIALLLAKVLFLRFFRRFYEQAKAIGTIVGIMSVVLVALTAGYYLAVSRLGKDRTVDRSASYAFRGPFLGIVQTSTPGILAVRTDPGSIERGRALFQARCSACHDPHSTRTIIGPGLQGLLKKPKLPVSGNPATAESIRFQLKQPLGRMPSFSYLSSDEMEDLIAYLNTL